MQTSTSEGHSEARRVVNLQAYREQKRTQQLINERREHNELLAERMINRWDTGGAGSGSELFYALMEQATSHRAFTKDQAKSVVPSLLQVR